MANDLKPMTQRNAVVIVLPLQINGKKHIYACKQTTNWHFNDQVKAFDVVVFSEDREKTHDFFAKMSFDFYLCNYVNPFFLE